MKTLLAAIFSMLVLPPFVEASVRVKEVAHIDGVRDNALAGYGIVTGLAGTGDSSRSQATNQSVRNALEQFGIQVDGRDVNSRNVAVVIVTATLPPFGQAGDKIDVAVSSLGDARSLVGGTLLMTPLKGANQRVYALAQGQVSVGGYNYDLNGNVVQKNHPTVGIIPVGATIEKSVSSAFIDQNGNLNVVLNSPDFTTANRLKTAINLELGGTYARAVHPGRIAVAVPPNADVVDFITKVENVSFQPDRIAKIVVNERTGTVVAGGDVKIDDVTISHGDLKIIISTDFSVSQPQFVVRTGEGVRTVVVPDTQINVQEDVAHAVDLPSGTTISDLVAALRQIKTSTRDVITILQAINSAGALHAQLVIQ